MRQPPDPDVSAHGPLRRWLTRPSWVPPTVRATLAIVLGALAVIGIAAGSAPGATTAAVSHSAGVAPPTKLPEPPGPGNPTARFPTSTVLRAEGMALYQQSCSSCHGEALEGQRGIAPALRQVGPGPVDFYLSTGRMPLDNPTDEPIREPPAFDRQQIDALIAYISSYGGPPAPTADPSRGSLALGQQVFTSHCAGCHQEVARGGPTLGAWAPDLMSATPQQVAEAVRMGPYVMPHFDANDIDQHDLDSLARYIQWAKHPTNSGGWAIYNLGPIPEGMVAWFIGIVALILVARLIGERTA